MSYNPNTDGGSILRLPLKAPGDTARRGGRSGETVEGRGREPNKLEERVSQLSNSDRNADIYLPCIC